MAVQVKIPKREVKVEPPKKKKGLGGKLGSALGAAAGLTAGALLAGGTGGASAAALSPLAKAGAITGLAGGGASLGGLAGELISPTEPGQAGGVVQQRQGGGVPIPNSSSIDRKAEILQQNPLLSIRSAIEALPKAPMPVQQEALPQLLQAYQKVRVG